MIHRVLRRASAFHLAFAFAVLSACGGGQEQTKAAPAATTPAPDGAATGKSGAACKVDSDCVVRVDCCGMGAAVYSKATAPAPPVCSPTEPCPAVEQTNTIVAVICRNATCEAIHKEDPNVIRR